MESIQRCQERLVSCVYLENRLFLRPSLITSIVITIVRTRPQDIITNVFFSQEQNAAPSSGLVWEITQFFRHSLTKDVSRCVGADQIYFCWNCEAIFSPLDNISSSCHGELSVGWCGDCGVPGQRWPPVQTQTFCHIYDCLLILKSS